MSRRGIAEVDLTLLDGRASSGDRGREGDGRPRAYSADRVTAYKDGEYGCGRGLCVRSRTGDNSEKKQDGLEDVVNRDAVFF